jgi:hypothetical protein
MPKEFDFDNVETHEHVWELVMNFRGKHGMFGKLWTCPCGAIKEMEGEIGNANPRIIVTEA